MDCVRKEKESALDTERKGGGFAEINQNRSSEMQYSFRNGSALQNSEMDTGHGTALQSDDIMGSQHTNTGNLTSLGSGITNEMPIQCKKMKNHGGGPFSALTPWRNRGYEDYASHRTADLEYQQGTGSMGAFDTDDSDIDVSDSRMKKDYIQEYNRLHSGSYEKPAYGKRDDLGIDSEWENGFQEWEKGHHEEYMKPIEKYKMEKRLITEGRENAKKHALDRYTDDEIEERAVNSLKKQGVTKEDSSFFFFRKLWAKHQERKNIRDNAFKNYQLKSYLDPETGKYKNIKAKKKSLISKDRVLGMTDYSDYKEEKKKAENQLKETREEIEKRKKDGTFWQL